MVVVLALIGLTNNEIRMHILLHNRRGSRRALHLLAAFGVTWTLSLAACVQNEGEPVPLPMGTGAELDRNLRQELMRHPVDGDPFGGRGFFDGAPWKSPRHQISEDPVAQLGMQLFYSSHLSGQDDVACVTCHVNSLGGGDGRALPIGPDGEQSEVMGPTRKLAANAAGRPVPRNSPTMFNAAAWDRCLLADCRIESLGAEPLKGGDDQNGISTPDVGHGREDPDAEGSLLLAHLRFPLNSEVVMRGLRLPEMTSMEYANCLVEKLSGRGACAGLLESVHGVSPEENPWPQRFAQVFLDDFEPDAAAAPVAASDAVTLANLLAALEAYERTLSFANTPFRSYLAGDDTAMTEPQKRGAIWFYREPKFGGAGCAKCHSGDLFSDERMHNVGFVQIGPGGGAGALGDADWGRGAVTNRVSDRFKFRTPTLLNVETSGPYGHNGAYVSLADAIWAHVDPVAAYQAYDFDNAPFTAAPENARFNSESVLIALQAETDYPFVELSAGATRDLVAFLSALTDPCVKDRSCLAPFDPFQAGFDAPNMGLLHPHDEKGCSLLEPNGGCP